MEIINIFSLNACEDHAVFESMQTMLHCMLLLKHFLYQGLLLAYICGLCSVCQSLLHVISY